MEPSTAKGRSLDGIIIATTSVILPAGNKYGYETQVGNGNFKGSFQGDVEAATPDGFAGTQYVRADFYYMPPGTGNGTYWGYFQFDADGTMTFTAGRSQSIAPGTHEYLADQRGARRWHFGYADRIEFCLRPHGWLWLRRVAFSHVQQFDADYRSHACRQRRHGGCDSDQS